MDTFKMNKSDVLSLKQNDFLSMFIYAWTIFNLKRDPNSFKKKEGEDVIYFNNEEFVSNV